MIRPMSELPTSWLSSGLHQLLLTQPESCLDEGLIHKQKILRCQLHDPLVATHAIEQLLRVDTLTWNCSPTRPPSEICSHMTIALLSSLPLLFWMKNQCSDTCN
jgi:hypothetical protein